MTWYDIIDTPMGWTGALASVQGLRRTTLPQATPDECLALLGTEASSAEHTPGRFTRVRDDLLRLFDGEPVEFDGHDIDVGDAPPFHRAAWLACRSIPVGEKLLLVGRDGRTGIRSPSRRTVDGPKQAATGHPMPQGDCQRRWYGRLRQGLQPARAEEVAVGRRSGEDTLGPTAGISPLKVVLRS